jgi:cytochrome c oxidase cbb3-type subunit 3
MSDVKRTDEIQGDILHVYDGIEEADNRLPNWWLLTFYAAMVFAVGYWVYYHTFSVGKLPYAAYQEERKQQLEGGGEVTDEQLAALAADPLTVPEGKRVFDSNCVQCHGERAEGKIGPNLTDEYWLHGAQPTHIYKTVFDGVPDKGMLAWGGQLGPAKVKQVTAYVMSLVNTNVPGKEPQGDKASAATPPDEVPQEPEPDVDEG